MNPATKHYYDIIEETFGEYESYYKGIGFLLEGGNGYYFFPVKSQGLMLWKNFRDSVNGSTRLTF